MALFPDKYESKFKYVTRAEFNRDKHDSTADITNVVIVSPAVSEDIRQMKRQIDTLKQMINEVNSELRVLTLGKTRYTDF